MVRHKGWRGVQQFHIPLEAPSSSLFVYQQTEQLPRVWWVFFCTKLCHSHVHTVLRSQTDLQLFGKLAPAYLSTLGKTAPCVVCVLLSITPFTFMPRTQRCLQLVQDQQFSSLHIWEDA